MKWLTVATWNLEWATTGSHRGQQARSVLDEIDADILCLTEIYPDMLTNDHNTILADSDYGYERSDGRRKVALWSRFGWTEVDQHGSVGMPGGRFVAARTNTDIGPLRIVGICIPWAQAHVQTGRRESLPWAEHLAFLDGLHKYL